MSEVPEGMEVSGVMPRAPRPSASLMLTKGSDKDLEVLLAHRVESLPAFPGYWSFPGGGIGRLDKAAVEQIPSLAAMKDPVEAATQAGMHRELLEELGMVATARGVLEEAPVESRMRCLDDKSSWLEDVNSGVLPLCLDAFVELTRRTTPEFAPMRFENRFMHMHCTEIVPEPRLEGQTEFDAFRWVRPADILDEWRLNKTKVPPPLITILKEVVAFLPEFDGDMESLAVDLSSRIPEEKTIMFASGVECIPIPTATLPPATTTNSYLIGLEGGEHILIDPAVQGQEGLARVSRAVERMEDKGGRLIAVMYTHRHLDHLGDPSMLPFGDIEVWCSEETSSHLPMDVERVLIDGETIELVHPDGTMDWEVLITPGHCPGHVCLHSPQGLVAGDMVAGIGTILIPSDGGRMEVYLEQLERLESLDPHLLFPSHGPVLPLPRKVFRHYLKHRRARHEMVYSAVEEGLNSLGEITGSAYSDSPEAHPILARQQTLSHLEALCREGRISSTETGWSTMEAS